ncbi:DUF4349 domain-containing protein [Radiobacillus kanasensis]|uniref:DUF4349 domain-containing protein n=1 Tax=Radiobacillus kanasensis TaxID=2844358 RepID=UPI001E3552F6|nr:DUF4349 domain-containing protein [Radiobacillus kanasensis]UFT99742.1 DUF4349 domain-containing protein [Radiobacillus kanasensis]
MWKRLGLLFILVMFVVGCSSNSDEEGSTSSEGREAADKEANTGTAMLEKTNTSEDTTTEESTPQSAESSETPIPDKNRKIIYTANLELEVKDYQTALSTIEDDVFSTGGYIVESSSYREEENLQGTITVRIPQEKFRDFLTTVEETGTKLVNKSVNGQDVTEEYVDLESRLASKQVVEKRLLQFMEKAEKTEDLLKISSDLAMVQEEIEQIKGRMKYLDNKSDLATVTIQLIETSVNIPGIEKDSLNTWEKTKEQFMNSVNGIIGFGSGLFIFIIGNLPVLLLVGLFSLGAFILYKKVKKAQRNESS